jgi:hypothetical protein
MVIPGIGAGVKAARARRDKGQSVSTQPKPDAPGVVASE